MTSKKREMNQSFYVAGGTMRPDAPSYIERRADKDLYQALLRGEFCYVLTARQMGKSSLMIRTATRLREAGLGVAVLDLTAIGQNVLVEQWYGGLIMQIGQRLGLEDELIEFWECQTLLGPLQRWMKAIRTIVLTRFDGRLVIFIDEIDAVGSLPFSTDEFFAGIRECYNQRNEDEELQRITFCLLGVASPPDLIRDTRTTPFNIGYRVVLRDFNEEEAAPLVAGLRLKERHGATAMKRILYWTGGHPYLTQRLCLAASEIENSRSRVDIDGLCADLFFSGRAWERDANFLFVRERLLRCDVVSDVLDLYAKVFRGEAVPDDETNPLANILRLSGITRAEDGRLKVRNRIYAYVFDRAWITNNMPAEESRRQRAAYRRGVWRTAIVSALIITVIGSLALIALRLATANRRLLDYTGLKLAPPERRNVSADEAEDLLTATIYHTQIKLALQEWDNSNIDRVEELLDTSIPEQGKKDWRSFEWYWLRYLTRSSSFNLREESNIVSTAFLDEGRTLAIGEVSRAREKGYDEYRIKSWDLKSGRVEPLFTIAGGQNFDLVVFSPDKRTVAVDGPDRDIVLCDIQSGARKILVGHTSAITAITFSPDARYLASADMDRNLKLWDALKKEEIRTLKLNQWIVGASFSPDSRWLATTDETNAVRFWNVATGQEQPPFKLDRARLVRAVFFPDGKKLAVTAKDGMVYLIDIQTRKVIVKLKGHSREVKAIAFSSDGKLLATASVDRTIILWDIAQREEIRVIRGHGSEITSVIWSSDDKSIVTSSLDGTIKVWDVWSRYGPFLPVEPVDTYLATTFSTDNKLIAFGGNAELGMKLGMKLWDLSTGRELARLDLIPSDQLCASFSSDNKLLATGGVDHLVKIWDVATGNLIHTLSGHTDNVQGVMFSPQGTLLVSGGGDRRLFIWDVASGEKLGEFRSDIDNYYRAVFSPDGSMVASARRDGSVVLWDANTRSVIHILIGHTDQVRAIAFSSDGRQLATGGKDNTIRLWDVATGLALKKPARVDYVQRVAFSFDGRRLVTGGVDGSVKMWDVVMWQEMMTLEGHTGEVTSVKFSADGSNLATSSDDGTVRLWHAEPLE